MRDQEQLAGKTQAARSWKKFKKISTSSSSAKIGPTGTGTMAG